MHGLEIGLPVNPLDRRQAELTQVIWYNSPSEGMGRAGGP